MPVNRSDLADFSYFLAIARHRNFRLAGLELGVSASALSHALKGLEARLGVRLFNRTNRSVTLTAAGEELRSAIAQPFEAIDQAKERLNRYRDAPAGRIRLNVPGDAAELLLAPVLPLFMDRYPEVEVDVVVADRMVDIVGEGFDAGIRHGGTVPDDMIAVRLSSDISWGVAAAPSYLEKFGAPKDPHDLRHHRCLGFRLGDDRIYHWEFDGPEREIAVTVPSQVTVAGGRAMMALALAGAGLMYGNKAIFQPHLERGHLQLVLEDWSSASSGYHIYYSSRRQVPTGLRLLIELIKELHPQGR
ncbi:LysR family transcriptional regulator [Sphingobium bisphenolivorans]|uniref:LysR family transcriptional regulator n=1 Tax=Sphingobium bisphenolivorans TaxID=1335760 RepID=UPI0003AA9DDE|nr:LysR family transcriptional regulator [Sphingobium bisphenolivorans]